MIGWNSYLRLYYIKLDPVLTILNLITYFKNTKNLFIHIALIPIGDSPRDITTF